MHVQSSAKHIKFPPIKTTQPGTTEKKKHTMAIAQPIRAALQGHLNLACMKNMQELMDGTFHFLQGFIVSSTR